MKKITTLAAIAAVAGLASCTAQAPKANLKTELDSLSYSIGMAQTQGLKGYLVGRMDVDTAYLAEFIKGVNEGAKKSVAKGQTGSKCDADGANRKNQALYL